MAAMDCCPARILFSNFRRQWTPYNSFAREHHLTAFPVDINLNVEDDVLQTATAEHIFDLLQSRRIAFVWIGILSVLPGDLMAWAQVHCAVMHTPWASHG